MKIYTQTKTNNKNFPAFKKGLTKDFVLKANKLSCEKAKYLLNQKGIENIDFMGEQAVAASCLATAEIMQGFGLTLPKTFLFKLIDRGCTGTYIFPDNLVCINSNYKDFKKLKSQDVFHSIRDGSPITKHFLHTYIHEFLHAAHFNNLLKKHPIEKIKIISNFLMNSTPKENLLNFNLLNKTWKKQEIKHNGSILGSYAKKSLMEFFAESVSFEIESILEMEGNILGKNKGNNVFFNPKVPENISLLFLKNKSINIWDKIFNKKISTINELQKAIWNGDLDTVFSKKYSKYIVKNETT